MANVVRAFHFRRRSSDTDSAIRGSKQGGFVIYMVTAIMVVLAIYAETIISTQYMSVSHGRRKLNELQAYIFAHSGLNVAQAFAAGYDGKSPSWEVQELKHALFCEGTALISTRRNAGWIRVQSKGIFAKDTVVLSGILGKSPPPFVANALNVAGAVGEMVIADRAGVYGNVGIKSGTVVTKGNGVFRGAIAVLKDAEYDGEMVETELRSANGYFLKRKSAGYVVDSLHDHGAKRLIALREDGVVFIDTSVYLQSDSIDCKGTVFYIAGDMTLGKSAVLKNAKCYCARDIVLREDARVRRCTLLSLGKAIVRDNARFTGTIACSDSLVIRDNAAIEFPSFVYLSSFSPSGFFDTRTMVITDHSIVRGVVATGRFGSDSYNTRMMLLGRARIEGLLACPGAVTLYGSVSGSVWAGRIVYRQEKTIFENWLKEVWIRHEDVSGITVPFLFPRAGIPRYSRITRVVKAS